MKKISKIFIFALITLSLFFVLSENIIFINAQTGGSGVSEQGEYIPLSPLPNTTNAGGGTDFSTYVRGMFGLLIGGAAVLAVIKIVLGGIQYMSTDAISGKSEGKDIITQALYGLLLAIGCWLILYTINPDILKFDVLSGTPNTPETNTNTTYNPNASQPGDPPGPYDKIIDCIRSTGPTAGEHRFINNGHFENYRSCVNSLPSERTMSAPLTGDYYYSICSAYSISCDPTPPSP